MKLLIDTATVALTLALFNDNEVVDYTCKIIEKDHSTLLLPEIDQLLKRNELTINDIVGFVVSQGPGSYTGVRIGVTVAKIFSFTLNKPLYKMSTLEFISASYDAEFIVPIIDARRGNVFGALYKQENGKLINILEDNLYPFSELIKIVKEKAHKALFVGHDIEKFKTILDNEELNYAEKFTFEPNSARKINLELVNEIHTFVPNYQRLPEAELNLQ